MKKFLILLVAVAILVPATVHAFSFVDILNFGKKLIQRETQPVSVEVKTEAVTPSAQFSAMSAENKYQNWNNAYLKHDVAEVFSDNRNLYFTEAELNYLVAQQLASATDPIARDVAVSFSDNLIKISGYSLVKNFSGQFYLEAKIVTVDQRINFQVTRARFHNFYFPTFIAQALLRSQLGKMIDFLYSSHDYQNLSVTVGSGFVQLNYSAQ
jgi:hypothetical protein